MTMMERDLHADRADILREAVFDSVGVIAQRMPPSPYRELLRSVAQCASMLQEAWWQAMGGPTLVRMGLLLLGDQQPDEVWPTLSRTIAPLLTFYLFEAASDDLGLEIAKPNSEQRRQMLSQFHQVALPALQTDAPIDVRSLPAVGSQIGFRVNPRQQADVQRYCRGSHRSALQDGRQVLIANVIAGQHLIQHTSSWPLGDMIKDCVCNRYLGIEQLLQHVPVSFQERLEIGEHTISGMLVVLFNTAAADMLSERGCVEEADPELLWATAATTSRLVRLLNDAGNILLVDEGEREAALADLPRELADLPPDTPVRSALEQHAARLSPIWNRVVKDVLLGEFNTLLDMGPETDLASSLELLCDNVRAAVRAYQEGVACLDALTAPEQHNPCRRVARRFLMLHQHMYSLSASDHQGEFVVVDRVCLG